MTLKPILAAKRSPWIIMICCEMYIEHVMLLLQGFNFDCKGKECIMLANAMYSLYFIDTAEAGGNLKEDGDKDDHQIKVSASSKSNVRRYSNEGVAGINGIQEHKEEGGEIEKIRETDENKMGERDADVSSLVLSSFKPASTDEEVCVDNLSTQQFNDSLDNNMGDFSMSTPLKPSAEGKGSFEDTFSSFSEVSSFIYLYSNFQRLKYFQFEAQKIKKAKRVICL